MTYIGFSLIYKTGSSLILSSIPISYYRYYLGVSNCGYKVISEELIGMSERKKDVISIIPLSFGILLILLRGSILYLRDILF